MRVLVFGDSITQGYWDTEGGWVDRLRKYYDELQVKDFDTDQPTVFNLGISADDSQDILDRAEAEIKARTRHNISPIVIIQVGVNDSCTEPTRNRVPIEVYKSNLEKLVNQIQPISSKIIFVGLSACDETKTTPVRWGEYYYTNQSIKAYENQMKLVAGAANIPFVPVFDAFVRAMHDRELLADGLHPNNEGHEAYIRYCQSPNSANSFSRSLSRSNSSQNCFADGPRRLTKIIYRSEKFQNLFSWPFSF